MIDIVICLFGGFILGFVLGGKVMKAKILTLLARMREEYKNGI